MLASSMYRPAIIISIATLSCAVFIVVSRLIRKFDWELDIGSWVFNIQPALNTQLAGYWVF